MSEDNRSLSSAGKRVSLKNLYLDPNNFRLIHEVDQINVPDEKIKEKDVAQRTYKLILGEKNQNIQDLIDSFKSNGYLPVDQIQVRELAPGSFVIVEGNRRIAALKYLQHEYEQKHIDLGRLDPEIFSRVPVILYDDPDEIHHLTLMGLNHISGKRKWPEWNQAKLLEKLRVDFGLDEDEIIKRIPVGKYELRRSLRALALANQYRESDYGDQFKESMFPIFREAARNTVLKEWLGWDDANYLSSNTENRDLFFSWLSREPVEHDDGSELVGTQGDFLDPAIIKRDDVATLSKILKDERALDYLQKTRDLNGAFRNSDLIFSEKIEMAMHSVNADVATLTRLAIQPSHLPDLEKALGTLQGIVDKARGSGLSGVEQTTVFFDRIDSHFSSITLEAYKGLRNLTLSKLSRVNLIAGLNNSGKTSLLEGIYLLARQNDFDGILEVIRRRGKIPEDHIQPQWLVEQISGAIAISGVFDDKSAEVNISVMQESSTSLDMSRYLTSVEISSRYDSYGQESITRIYKDRDRESQADSIKLLCKAIFSSPFFLNEPYHYSTFYHKSVRSKSLQKIFEFIREEIVPTINDIRLVQELQRFLVDDSRFQESVDLTSYGEGLQRIFFISLLFASAENGLVLIDEFENAIHTSLITKFAPFIHKLSIEFNVQVFLTSHSKECIDAFVRNVTRKEDFSFHALVSDKEGKIEIREFDGNEFATLLRVSDVDLRRAQ